MYVNVYIVSKTECKDLRSKLRARLARLSDTDIQLKWDQLPDVVVNIMSGTQRVGYIRYDAQTLYKKSNPSNPKPNEEW